MLLRTDSGNMGDKAPDFHLKTPEGRAFTRDDIMGENGMMVAFICNHCPYVIAVIERLVADIKELQDAGIGVACVMSNNYAAYPADSPENMIKFAANHGMTAPYLVDEDQSVAQAYDAVCTPDFFGFDADGRLVYRGRIDSALMGDPTGRDAELRDAMLAVARGEEAPADQKASMGCSIKWR